MMRLAGESLKISILDESTENQVKLKLVPDPPWPEISRIMILVGEDDYRIRTVEIINQMEGLTRFILGDLQPEENFLDNFFRFDAPEGVKIIDETT